MPRYMVQRTFPQGLEFPVADGGADICRGVVERNADDGVTWVHSYVSTDKRTTFCVYDAPTPGGHPPKREPQSPPHRHHHRSSRSRPLLLRISRTPEGPQTKPKEKP